MRFSLRRFLSVLFVIGFLCLSGNGFIESVNVYALSDGAFLSDDVARSYFGDTINAKYWTSNGYVDVVYRYDGVCRFYGAANGTNVPSGFDDSYLTGAQFIRYTANLTGLLQDPTQIVIDIEPQYRITDTYQIHSAIGLKGSNYSISAYSSAAWDWYFSGQNVHFEQVNNGQQSSTFKDRSFYDYYNMVFADMSSQSSTSGYSLRATFPVANTASYLVIGCPYVSIGSSGGSGISGLNTGSSGSSGTSGGVTSEDLEETNGLLSSLINAVDGLIDGILSLFIPDEEFLEDWIEDMQELLSDHLGGIYQAIEEIADMFDSITGISAATTFHVDACNIPLAGSTLTLGNWDVPLKTAALPQIFYDALALIIDFLVSAAFLNMCKRKLEIFLNPDSEKV